MSSSESPQYGYGVGGRPLWTPRDLDAEVIRLLLRKAECVEFSTELGASGFAVEAAEADEDGAEPFLVTCAGPLDDVAAAQEIARYAEVLQAADYCVVTDQDDEILEVQLPGVPAPAK
jgi:hypothetical protein